MSEQDLRELIQSLKQEIEALPGDDDAARRKLEGIVGELEKKLDAPGSEDHQGLVSGLQDSIKELEARHPDTTTLLNNIMMTLANMGI